ncbi:MAG TPA: FAD-dependent oxidoreductase [Deltaproteobacteria bacterium]|nr:FAD-dependent oxidoreductase [Deltaproteobacteria bacterium]
MRQLVIVGGSDAGICAALRAKEIAPDVEVTMALADRYPNFSICGLPFFISGEVADWRNLAHRSLDEIEAQGIRVLLEHRVLAIDARQKRVKHAGLDGITHDLAYDRLLIATGAVSTKPPIAGLDLPGVFMLRWMEDGLSMHAFMEEHDVQSAVVIGGGYIGLEMADALKRRGARVTVVEFAGTLLTTLDDSLGAQLKAELERHGVEVMTGRAVKAVEPCDGGLVVRGDRGLSVTADMVLVAAGCRPAVELAKQAGVAIGGSGAIKVDRAMRTNLPDVFAAGDCVETWHNLLGRDVYLPLGTTAHKQGRVAGENMAGGEAVYAGSLGTQAVKVFDLVAARTGLRDREAVDAGYTPLTVGCETWDHKVYYPGARPMQVLITADVPTRRLLGAQILGHRSAEVSKRVDIIAAALFHRMTVEQVSDIDLSYTPPLSSPWDPVQQAAQAWLKNID